MKAKKKAMIDDIINNRAAHAVNRREIRCTFGFFEMSRWIRWADSVLVHKWQRLQKSNLIETIMKTNDAIFHYCL